MATIRKSLSRKKQNESGKHEIMLRLSFCRGKVYRIKSLIYINPKFWNVKKGEVMIPRVHTKELREAIDLQRQLNELTSFIEERCATIPIEELDKECLEHIVHVFHYGEDEKTDGAECDDFFEHLNTFILVRVKTKNRESQFYCLKHMLERYELYRGKGFKITLDSMTDVDLARFEEFLRIEHAFFDDNGKCIKYANIYASKGNTMRPKPRSSNGIHNIMKRLRTFYNWAVKTGRTTNNPFKKYQLPTCVYGTPFFISKAERNKLFKHDFSATPQLAIQRDIFVFQSCIGIRTGDLYKLTKDNVVGDYIEYIANKTLNKNGYTVKVPLIQQAKTILERYKDKNGKELLPFISTQHYNKAIKLMLKAAGITRVVTVFNPMTMRNEQHPIYEVATSYMARRNFIGNLYKEVKDANLIGSMTGHSEGSKAFARYRAIDDDIKKSVISKLE